MKAELRKEYAEIADAHVAGCADHVRDRAYAIAIACQELADRPMKELTDAEILELHRKVFPSDDYFRQKVLRVYRSVIAADRALQREPETVKFRAARRADTDRIEMFPSDFVFSSDMWEWLDADGKPQEFEVKLP